MYYFASQITVGENFPSLAFGSKRLDRGWSLALFPVNA